MPYVSGAAHSEFELAFLPGTSGGGIAPNGRHIGGRRQLAAELAPVVHQSTAFLKQITAQMRSPHLVADGTR